MTTVFVAWGLWAFVMLLVAIRLGYALKKGYSGVLIDNRGRYSLTQFQVVLWTLVLLSLIAGLFFARVISGVENALAFSIPDELLIVMGISIGGSAVATTIKAGKDTTHPERVAASNEADRPRLAQMFLLEEGERADQVVDVTKFQNFWITLILVVAYVVLVIKAVTAANTVAEVVLPGFSGTFLTLLGISHAGYLAGKIPDHSGSPRGLTVALSRQGAIPAASSVAPLTPLTYIPRNP